jgi:hypothetical protein
MAPAGRHFPLVGKPAASPASGRTPRPAVGLLLDKRQPSRANPGDQDIDIHIVTRARCRD